MLSLPLLIPAFSGNRFLTGAARIGLWQSSFATAERAPRGMAGRV